MKLLSLAIASLVDANTNQGYTRQYLESSEEVAGHVQRARSNRSRVILSLFSKISDALRGFVERSRARAENRQAVEQLLRMNEHMLLDIGLTHSDVKSVDAGLISLDELSERRQANHSVIKSISSAQRTSVDNSVRKIESSNDDCFEFAKCG